MCAVAHVKSKTVIAFFSLRAMTEFIITAATEEAATKRGKFFTSEDLIFIREVADLLTHVSQLRDGSADLRESGCCRQPKPAHNAKVRESAAGNVAVLEREVFA
eukprot:IDg19865t1